MGTRSRIGIQNQNGSITSVYCHYDGYPEGVGQELIQNYTSPVEVNELLSKGDMSSLHSKQFFKDRGETDVDSINSENEQEYLEFTGNCWGEYAYLYRDGEWEVCPIRDGGNKFTPVQALLKEEA